MRTRACKSLLYASGYRRVQHIQDYGAIPSQPPCRAARPCKATCPPGTRSRAYHSISPRLTSVDEKCSVCVHAPTRDGGHRALTQRRLLVNRFRRNRRTWKRSCVREQETARERARLKQKTSPADSDRFVTTGIVVIGGVIVARSFATDRLLLEDEISVKD